MDEDDLTRVANEKKIMLLLKQFYENCHSETLICRKLSPSSDMQSDALMHRDGLQVRL